jgi:transposase
VCLACNGGKKTRLGEVGRRGPDLELEQFKRLALKRKEKAAEALGSNVLCADDDKPILHAASPRARRNRIIEFIGMRAKGMSTVAIAAEMGISRGTLHTHISRAVKEGWLKFDDPLSRFEQEIVPKVVDNIEHFIDAKDRTMTIEAAKGAGIFKSHQAIKVDNGQPTTVLALKIEAIDPDRVKVISSGHIVGKARQLEARNAEPGLIVDA